MSSGRPGGAGCYTLLMTAADLPADPLSPLDQVTQYHQRTKHQFNRYARSLGYLDWANQP
ncbi:MAG: hypothetical protein H6749_07700, partial [Nitrospiraceae bacterium]|nr:hypothetical protein [Nitrospiraceae bacterium]